MNILYISLSYVPSRRASSMHVMRMCAALSRAGHQVTLLAKCSDEPTAAGIDDHAFYGVAPTFKIVKLASPPRRGGAAIFSLGITRTLLARRSQVDLVYARDVVGAAIAAELRIPLVFEAHDVPHHPIIRPLFRRITRHRSLRGFVVISRALARDLVVDGLSPSTAPIVVAPDAADLDFPFVSARTNVRPRIGYAGNLYAGRGIELLRRLATRMPAVDIELLGGSEQELARWRSEDVPPNLKFLGFVSPASLPERYRGYDTLVMPYERVGIRGATGKSDTSRWASPMKMFEYMASGTPIVASDLPVLGEVLRHEHNALIAAADDVSAWQQAIERLLANRALATRLARQARNDLETHYTWDRRVDRIFRSAQL